MMTAKTATEAAMDRRSVQEDERTLHARIAWFTEKWTTALDLNKRDAAELNADLVMVVQAVHRDASRATHEMLQRALEAMPPQPIFVEKK